MFSGGGAEQSGSLSLLFSRVEYGRRHPAESGWEIVSRGGRTSWGEVQTVLLASCGPSPAAGRDGGGRWPRLCRIPRRPGYSPAQRLRYLTCGRFGLSY